MLCYSSAEVCMSDWKWRVWVQSWVWLVVSPYPWQIYCKPTGAVFLSWLVHCRVTACMDNVKCPGIW